MNSCRPAAGAGGSAALYFAVGPLDPGHQLAQVVAGHGGAAPDAQSGGGIPVGADIAGDPFGIQQLDDPLDLIGVEVEGQAHAGVGAHGLVGGEEVDPPAAGDEFLDHGEVLLRAGDGGPGAADALDPVEGIEVVHHAQHGGGVDG